MKGKTLFKYDDSRFYEPTFCDKYENLACIQSILVVVIVPPDTYVQ